MKQQNNTIKYILIGAAVWYGVRQYRLYQGLQFSVAGMTVSGTLQRPQLDVRIALSNTTGVAATLNSITGSIFTNNIYIAQVIYNTAQVIAPYNRTLITFNILPDVAGVVQYLVTPGKSKVFQFRGNAVINGVPFPVTMDYQFGTLTS